MSTRTHQFPVGGNPDFITNDPHVKLYVQRGSCDIKKVPDWMGVVLQATSVENSTITLDFEDADGYRAADPISILMATTNPVVLGDLLVGRSDVGVLQDFSVNVWWANNFQHIPKIAKVRVRSIVAAPGAVPPLDNIHGLVRVYEGLATPTEVAISNDADSMVESSTRTEGISLNYFTIPAVIPADYPYEWLTEGREFGLNANPNKSVVVKDVTLTSLGATVGLATTPVYFSITEPSGRLIVQFATTNAAGSVTVRIDEIVGDKIVTGVADTVTPGAVGTHTRFYDREEGQYRVVITNNHASAINGIVVEVLVHKI